MSEKLQVAIVGLGLVGRSAGLALHRYQEKLTVIGHDRSPELASRAKSAGAVERTEWNLINTIRDADRVILALPLNELRATLDAIKEDLRPGCVIVDTADVKAPVMQWAAELLPPTVHFVGGHPIVLADRLDADGARADLFTGKNFCLTADAKTDDSGVRLAADLVEALGAKPYFMDAEEHDGLVAAVSHLPALLATSLLSVTTGSPGWRDLRKLAGNHFFAGTVLVTDTGKEAIAGPFANREQVIPWLDREIAELTRIREHLVQGQEEALAEQVDDGLEASHNWLKVAMAGTEEPTSPAPDVPTMGSTFRDMFFGRLGRRADDTKQSDRPKRR